MIDSMLELHFCKLKTGPEAESICAEDHAGLVSPECIENYRLHVSNSPGEH